MPQVTPDLRLPDLTLVVPCYNEEKRLDPQAFLELAAAPGVRLLFVDDGSRDGTAAALARLCDASHGRAKWFSLPHNAGKAEAVRQGLLRALQESATLTGFTDADLSTPVAEILRLVEALRLHPQVQVVLASRVRLLGNEVERSPLRHYLGRIFATAASLTLDLAIYDTQCGAKLLRVTPVLHEALTRPFLSRWVFDVELIARLLRAGLAPEAFLEVPLQAWRDVQGSKLTALAMAKAAADLARIAMELRRR
jgi:dolichyl-phosphate beta-glucosyltransferase